MAVTAVLEKAVGRWRWFQCQAASRRRLSCALHYAVTLAGRLKSLWQEKRDGNSHLSETSAGGLIETTQARTD